MERVVKVVLVGDMSTGKSSILYRLLKNEPLDEGFPTVGVEVGSRSFFLRNSNVHVQFWDTAGQERFRSVCHQHYRGAQAAIIVFDLGNRTTFESLPVWLQRTSPTNSEVREHCEIPNVAICLLGNKVDCTTRQVRREEAANFANENRIDLYEEVSARTGENVEAAVSRFLSGTFSFLLSFRQQQSSWSRKTLDLGIASTDLLDQKLLLKNGGLFHVVCKLSIRTIVDSIWRQGTAKSTNRKQKGRFIKSNWHPLLISTITDDRFHRKYP
jgi:Rab family protein